MVKKWEITQQIQEYHFLKRQKIKNTLKIRIFIDLEIKSKEFESSS